MFGIAVLLCTLGADVAITTNDINEMKDRAFEECMFKHSGTTRLIVIVQPAKDKKFLDTRQMVPLVRRTVEVLEEMGIAASPDLQSSLAKVEKVLGLQSQGLRLTERARRVCWAWEVLKLQEILGAKTEVVFK